MYFTGTYQDYETRMHQFASWPGSGETGANYFSGINKFVTEGSGYVNLGLNNSNYEFILNMAPKWEREIRLSYYRLSGDGLLLKKSLLYTGIVV